MESRHGLQDSMLQRISYVCMYVSVPDVRIVSRSVCACVLMRVRVCVCMCACERVIFRGFVAVSKRAWDSVTGEEITGTREGSFFLYE